MAWTAADLDTLRAAMKDNTKRVTFADGRTTEFQNADQMLAVYKVAKAEVDLATRTATGMTRTRFATFGSGL